MPDPYVFLTSGAVIGLVAGAIFGHLRRYPRGARILFLLAGPVMGALIGLFAALAVLFAWTAVKILRIWQP